MRYMRLMGAIFAVALIAAACGGTSTSQPALSPELAEELEAVLEPAEVAVEAEHSEATEAEEATHSEAEHSEAAEVEEPTHSEEAAEAAHEHAEEAVGHDDDEVVAADFDRQIDVIMTEFAFEPAMVTVGAGEVVQFVVTNGGVVPHEFRLSTPHAVEEHLASGHEGHNEGGHAHGETLVTVDPGGTEVLEVTFDGDAEFSLVACLIPGHYEAGMVADLLIG